MGEGDEIMVCVDCGSANNTGETPCYNCGSTQFLDPSRYQSNNSSVDPGGPFQTLRPYIVGLTITTLTIPTAFYYADVYAEAMHLWLVTGWPWIPVSWLCMWIGDTVFTSLRR